MHELGACVKSRKTDFKKYLNLNLNFKAIIYSETFVGINT